MWFLLMMAFAQSGEDLANGKRWYSMHCSGCHGVNGDGGRGANLAAPVLPRASNEEDLIQIIARGIPGTEMPRSALTRQQLRETAAYVRSLGRVSSAPVEGDAERGRRIFDGKGNCRRCHAIQGEGGVLGPDLTGIAKRVSPGYLRASLLDPSAVTAPSYRRVRATSRAGRRIEGVRINEDTFSIQIRDPAGGLHSIWKSDAASLEIDRLTLMPAYRGKLSAAEVNDVIAYLVRQP